MTGPGVAVDAAVLAAAIGVDGTVKEDIGGGNAGDDGLRAVERHRCPKRQQVCVDKLPAVVNGFAALGLETARAVGHRAAALQRPCQFRIIHGP